MWKPILARVVPLKTPIAPLVTAKYVPNVLKAMAYSALWSFTSTNPLVWTVQLPTQQNLISCSVHNISPVCISDLEVTSPSSNQPPRQIPISNTSFTNPLTWIPLLKQLKVHT